jgi:hypothetical protein
MTYAQLLRVRNALTIYWIVIGVLFVLFMIVGRLSMARAGTPDSADVPLSALIIGAGLCTIIFATLIGISLNRENEGVEMVWTKPIDRAALAARYVALDLAAIVVAFGSVFLAIVVGMFGHGHKMTLVFDEQWVPMLLLCFGIAFMWYGLLQALTSWQLGRGGMMIGLSWAAAAIILPLFSVLTLGVPLLHEIAMVLNLLNPLAYLSSGNANIHVGVSTPGPSLVPTDIWARVAMTWGLGVAGNIVAITAWKRLEV